MEREAIHDIEACERGWSKMIRVLHAGNRLGLARARSASFSELRSLLREFDELSDGVEVASVVDHVYKERARIGILDPLGGDPARPTHQSRISCLGYPVYRSNFNSRFDHGLLVVDYWLACLRFAGGIGPVDDEFDKTPPSLVKLIPPDRQNFDRRLDKASVPSPDSEVRHTA